MRFLMTSLMSVLLVTSAGVAQSQQSSDQSDISAEEYAIYAAVISNMFAGDKGALDTQSNVKMLVIEDRTVNESYVENEGERLKQVFYPIFSQVVSQETIDDFVAKNAKSQRLTKLPDIKSKYTLIPKVKIEEIFKRGLDAEWVEFYKQFPGSNGYITLSRGGLNSKANQAIVYTQYICGGLCGIGYYILLVKNDRGWTVKKRFEAWIS